MTDQKQPRNSTNVRSLPLPARAARAGLRVLSPRAPALAARWAERLFLTARRHEAPPWERAALASADRGRLAHAGGSLPVWTWSPDALLETPKTVLLVHGWEGRGSQLAAFAPPLVARGLRVVTFDAPGHGAASLPLGSLVEHARALETVVRAIGPVHAIVGHSVGGAAALLATRFGVHAERYALIAPPRAPGRYAAVFARAFALDEEVKSAMVARLEARYAMKLEALDVLADAASLERELLVVHDRDDRVVGVDVGRAIADAAIRGELLETRGLGHQRVLRAPEVIDAVTAFASRGIAPTFAQTLDGELFVREARYPG